MKTILCASYEKQFLQHDYCVKNQLEWIEGIQFLTIRELFHLETETSFLTKLIFVDTVQKHQDDFSIYQQMLQFPTFYDEIIAFARSCLLWGIGLDDLPASTKMEQELKQFVTLFYDISKQTNVTEKQLYTKQKDILSKAHNTIDFYTCGCATNLFEKVFLDTLLNENPHILPYEEKVSVQKQEVFYALNTRQELEAVAQDLVNRKQKCMVVLTDYTTQYPILKQVFQRYEIPFSSIQNPTTLLANQIFVAILRYTINPTDENLVALLHNNVFQKPTSFDFITYFQEIYLPLLHQGKQLTKLDLFPYHQHLVTFFNQAETYYQSILPTLVTLQQATSYQEKIQAAYHLFKNHTCLSQEREFALGMKIYQRLNECISLIQTPLHVELLIDDILKLRDGKPNFDSDFCIVTDIHHALSASKVTYLIGCNSQTIPGFQSMKGLFDEDYVRKIQHYPSQQSRFHFNQKQIAWIFESGEHIMYSFSTNDYEGRSLELAFDVEKYLEPLHIKPQAWAIISHSHTAEKNHQLDQQTASLLFLDSDQRVHGSISRIERYFACPYSYFLQSGLKLRQPAETQIETNIIGTIIHYALEQFFKHHEQLDPLQQSKDIQPYFDELAQIFPTQTRYLNRIQKRMLDTLQFSLSFLLQAKQDSLFHPTHFEYRFTSKSLDRLHLEGIVDRIDTVNNQFRIIDYKSSDHTLSAKKIASGLQLQLATYMLFMEENLHMQPSGIYYYNFNRKIETSPAGKISKKQGFQETERNQPTIKKLTGWTFSNIQQTDSHFSNFYSSSSNYDLISLKQAMLDIYAYFIEHLLNGEIQLTPTKDACTYCPYRSICHFNKEPDSSIQILDPQSFSTTKEDTND